MSLIDYNNKTIFITLLLLCLQKCNLSQSVDAIANSEEGSTCSSSSSSSEEKEHYGMDISWPMHRHKVKHSPSLGDRQSVYDKYLQGCYGKYSKQSCDEYEKFRVDMIRRQPQSVRNYTSIGFKKIRAPENVFKLIKDFWETNKNEQSEENFSEGDAVANRWETPSYMVSVENDTLSGGGVDMRSQIWEKTQEVIRAWTGQELKTSSCYGIRVYKEGAVLTSHVDRLPLVSSAIINVAQDVDEDWPLEVIGHDGRAYNVTMEPGDMVLYESHSIIHGRPFALKGRFYANLFIHFAPTEISSGIPSYIIEGSPEDIHMRETNGYEALLNLNGDHEFSSTNAHAAAQIGDLNALTQIAETHIELLFETDTYGWTPLHEASRRGHVESIRFLIENGVDVHKTTLAGETALNLAEYFLEVDHEALKYLIGYIESNKISNTSGNTEKQDVEVVALEVDVLAALWAAKQSDLTGLINILKVENDSIFQSDVNGWTPLHEAARTGNMKVIDFLVANGSDVRAETNAGETALDIASSYFAKDHQCVQYLKNILDNFDAGDK